MLYNRQINETCRLLTNITFITHRPQGITANLHTLAIQLNKNYSEVNDVEINHRVQTGQYLS